MAAMREPALAQIVALRSAVIPVAGIVRNTNTLLGQDGITGLKTGSDTAAGGCILLAAWQQARGHDTLIERRHVREWRRRRRTEDTAQDPHTTNDRRRSRRVRRDGDDRDRRKRRLRAERARHGIAVHSGQLDIEQDNRWRDRPDQLQRLTAV